MSRKNRQRLESNSSAHREIPAWVWAFVGGTLLYAGWYFAAPMPWPPAAPGQVPVAMSRWQLLLGGIFTADTWIGHWFSSEFGLWDRIPIFVLVVLWLVIAAFVGRVGLSLLLNQPPLVLCIAFGLAILSWATSISGQLGWILGGPVLVVLAAGGMLALPMGLNWKELRQVSVQDSQRLLAGPTTAESRWWLLAAAPLLFFAVGTAVLPPYEYDVLEYHLQVPKEWHRSGHIATLPHNVYSGMPMAAEMWPLVSMRLWPGSDSEFHGALTGKLLIGLTTIAAAWLAGVMGLQLAGPWGGRAAAIATLAVPWLIYEAGTGLVDGVWALFTLAALYPVLRMHKSTFAASNDDLQKTELPDSPLGLAMVSGLFAGAAMSVKYPALPMGVVPVFLLWMYARGLDWKCLGIYSAAVVLVVSPWLIKNTVATGNPVFPLAGTVFADVRTEAQIEQWNAAHAVPHDSAGHRYSASSFLGGLRTFFGRSPWAGLAIVPLAVVGLIYPQRGVVVCLVVVLAAIGVVWWGFSHRLERFLVPAIPLGGVLAGLGAARLAEFHVGRLAVRGLLGLSLLNTFVLVNQTQSIKLDPRILHSLDSLRQSHTTHFIGVLNRKSGPAEVVLATGDAALFYLEPPTLYHTAFNDSPLKPLTNMTREERRRWLADRNIQWFYVHWGEINRFRSPGNYGFPEEVTRELINELKSQELVLGPLVEVYGSDKPVNPSVEVYQVQTAPRQ